MTGPTLEVSGRDKAVVTAPSMGASGSAGNSGHVPTQAAATGSEDNMSEMMGRLRLTAAEAVAVVLEDSTDVPVHSPWAIVGKVLAPNTLHINTIAAALRPAWGNPRGLVLNSAGDNRFVAEFGSKVDKDRVVNGPPWVVGKHAVLLRDFNIDLKPRDMVFNRLKIWARIINLPFGYMNQKSGTVIAGSIGLEGTVPCVDCDATGRSRGSYMRVRVEVDVDKPLRRGVSVFSQRRNATDWFDVQYENLPHYCFSCGIIGHSSTECKDPGERDAAGKLPYLADRLCAPDDRKKKSQGANPSSGSASAGQGSVPPQASRERSGQSPNRSGGSRQQKNAETSEVSSPIKKQSHPRTANTRTAKGQGKDKGPAWEGGALTVGRKRKSQQVYRPKASTDAEVVDNARALVVHNTATQEVNETHNVTDEASSDSNKKLKTKGDNGSADQAGAIEQPRQTQ
jgi:hypothetical protein